MEQSPPSNRSNRLRLGGLAPPALALAVLLVGVAFAVVDPRARLGLLATAGFLVGGIMTWATWSLARSYVTLPLLSAFYVLQMGLVAASVALGMSTLTQGLEVPIDLADHPIDAIFPQLLVPAGALCIAVFVYFVRALSPRAAPATPAKIPPMGGLSILFAAVMLIQWISLLPNGGSISYFVRVVCYTLSFTPFLGGWSSERHPAANRVWLVALAINAAIGMISGARSFAIIPLALYGLGRFLVLRGPARVRYGVVLAASAVPLLVVLGIVGVLRAELGRGGVEKVSAERVEEMTDRGSATMQDSGMRSRVSAQGFGRLIVWPNFAVTLMAPTPIPYRGYGSIPSELQMYSRLAFLEGTAQEARIDAGLDSAPANDFGFVVNEVTSVDFGLLADGWYRDGSTGALIFALLFAGFFAFAEAATRRLKSWRYGAYLAIMCALCHCIFQSLLLPAFSLIREAILYGAIILGFSFAFDLLAKLVGRKTSTRDAGAVASAARPRSALPT